VGRTDLVFGERYLYLDSTTRFGSGTAPPDVPGPEFATRDSGLGLVAEFDTRDDSFTASRGVPVMRYQGESAVSLEGEVRWGLTRRWWLVEFGGSGWTDV